MTVYTISNNILEICSSPEKMDRIDKKILAHTLYELQEVCRKLNLKKVKKIVKIHKALIGLRNRKSANMEEELMKQILHMPINLREIANSNKDKMEEVSKMERLLFERSKEMIERRIEKTKRYEKRKLNAIKLKELLLENELLR